MTYLLIDGENIDTTLGGILGGRPAPEFRPQWDKVMGFVQGHHGSPVKALFFLVFKGQVQFPFIQALRLVGMTPILLSGPPEVKIVDVAIVKTLTAIHTTSPVERAVALASHDGGDFAAAVEKLLAAKRQVTVLGFREFMSDRFVKLAPLGLQILDLEYDARSFKSQLPRIAPVDVGDFDPMKYL